MERVGRSGNHVGPAPSSSSSCRRGGASTTHAKLILKTGSNSVAQRIDLKDQAIELKRERGDVAAPPPWILRALRDAHLDCAQHQVHYYREIEPVPDRCLYASIHSPASVGRTTAGERTRGGIPGGVTHRIHSESGTHFLTHMEAGTHTRKGYRYTYWHSTKGSSRCVFVTFHFGLILLPSSSRKSHPSVTQMSE